MISSRVKIWSFCWKAHLIFHWCLYNKYGFECSCEHSCGPQILIKHLLSSLSVCWDYFKQRNRVPFHVDPRSGVRAVLKWLSKIITWLRLLRLVIGLKDSGQFFNQWEAKPKPIAPWTCDFSCASSELQVIARNCDWFIALPAPVVIGRSNCFGFGFSTVIWKPL